MYEYRKTLVNKCVALVIMVLQDTYSYFYYILGNFLLWTEQISSRTVPTEYKDFCARLGPRAKSRSLQGLLESRKKNRGSRAFFRDN